MEERAESASPAPSGRPDVPPRRRRRLRFWLALSAASVLLLAALGVGALQVADRVYTGRFERAVAALRARGEPVTAADTVPPPIPDEENGAPFLARASELLREIAADAERDALEAWYDEWDGKASSFHFHLEEAETMLRPYGPVLEMAEKIRSRPAVRLPLGYEKGLGFEVEPILELEEMTRLLSIRAVLRASEGRDGGALEDVGLILELGRAAGGGNVISFLLGASMQGRAGHTLEDVLRLCSAPAEDLRRLASRFAACEKDLDLRAALRNNRAVCLEALLAADRATRTGPFHRAFPLAHLWTARNAVRYLDRSESLIEAAGKPYPEARAALPAGGRRSKVDALAALLLAQDSTSIGSSARWLAQMRMASAACRLAAVRAERGAVPATLDGLDPPPPPDPFTGGPFIVRRGPEGLVLVSVCEDGRDAGFQPADCVEEEPAPAADADDLVFFLGPAPERPPAQEGGGPPPDPPGRNLAGPIEDEPTPPFPFNSSVGPAGGWARFLGPRFEPRSPSADLEGTAAVGRGLGWLARHQNEDGSWTAKEFGECRSKRCGGQGSLQDSGPALTGLALLAFLGAGQTHQQGQFRKVVRNGLRYLCAGQQKDGGMGSGPRDGKWIYGQAICTMAFAEAVAFSPKDPVLRNCARQAAACLCACRNPDSGWRYGARTGESDASCTAWAAMALAVAKRCGILVPPEAFQGARAFLDRATDPGTLRTGYRGPGDAAALPHGVAGFGRRPTPTAAALACRFFLGPRDREAPGFARAAQFLAEDLPSWDPGAGTIDFVYWHWGSLAMFQTGEDSWGPWFAALKKALVRNQVPNDPEGGTCAAGSWDPVDPWGPQGGRVYATALNVLSLETARRYARLD